MDVGIDQARPWAINDKGEKYRDLVRFASGKYLYRMPNGELEIDRFNRDFDQYKERRRDTMRKNIQKINESLQEPEEDPVNNIPISNTPVNKDRYWWILGAMILSIFLILVSLA